MADSKRDQRAVDVRDEWKNMGIEDISVSNQRQIGKTIHTLFKEAIDTVVDNNLEEIEVSEIIVCGSYAHNEAIKHMSDLDIRIVVTQSLTDTDHKQVQQYIQREYDCSGELFGYVDAQCHTDSLDSNYTRLWTP